MPRYAPLPVIATLDDALGRAAAAWVARVQSRAGLVLLGFTLAAVASLGYALVALGVNTNENDLFSEDLPFFALRDDFYAAFPTLVDPIVIVIDGDTVDLAQDAAERLARRIEQEPAEFGRVYQPGGGAFFEENGFLYLEPDELSELVENLFAVQPFLGELARDPSLRGLFSMLADAVEAQARGDLEGVDLSDVLMRLDEAVEAHLSGHHYRLSWADVIMGRESTPHDRRRFLLVQPVVDFEQLHPAEASLLGLRDLIDELGLGASSGVRVRATGVFPLSYEEMEHLSQQTTLAGLASFVLVALILVGGLGSLRLVLASLYTLLVGLALTAAFAALAVGHLNLISVAFAVLFIGLSIDFAIHLCVRYRELLGRGVAEHRALPDAAGAVGGSLALCATTTAIGFYAFVPTEYAGVAELGLIAGTGMFISLITNLTLLPAAIAWGVSAASISPPAAASDRLARWMAFPVRHARAVVGFSGLLVVGALAVLPRIHFDPNPLRMRDPSAPSVQVFNEMLADGDALPWNLNVLVPDAATAREISERLEALPAVDLALTLDDFVPEDQDEKLEMLEDAAFVLLPTLEPDDPAAPPSPAQQIEATAALEASLDAVLREQPEGELAASAARLRDGLSRLRTYWARTGSPDASLAELQRSIVGSLPERLRILRASIQPAPVSLADLPAELVERMTATDGRARIEIFPKDDLNDREALEEYVSSVQAVAPDAFGEGLVILETGAAVVRALVEALTTAAILIGLLLLLLWRNLMDAALVAIPLALAVLFTSAGSVLFDVPINFANVIVIPLLLGMGVDTGIHLVHRTRTEVLPDGNLLRTSTAGAVLLSALTTTASFGTLAFSSHLGMASLGKLLAMGIALIVVCNLVVLPALVRVTGRAR